MTSPAEERAALLAELCRCDDAIQQAYWAFTRQARAKPPFLVVPEAYHRRRAIRQRLAELRAEEQR